MASYMTPRCWQIKGGVVGKDETEEGCRAVLNFGHTIGHAIENSVGNGRYLHGEAISIGQVAAAHLSEALLGLPGRDVVRIHKLLATAGLPTDLRLGSAQRRRLFAAMKVDKKVSNGEVRFVLAERIGKARWGQKAPPALLEGCLFRKDHQP